MCCEKDLGKKEDVVDYLFGWERKPPTKKNPEGRCKNCGAYLKKNKETGRWYCPAREAHRRY